MRRIDDGAITAHADPRCRSEYDDALFEYYRSVKVIAFLSFIKAAPRGEMKHDDLLEKVRVAELRWLRDSPMTPDE